VILREWTTTLEMMATGRLRTAEFSKVMFFPNGRVTA
jgi:hypothetical protein